MNPRRVATVIGALLILIGIVAVIFLFGGCDLDPHGRTAPASVSPTPAPTPYVPPPEWKELFGQMDELKKQIEEFKKPTPLPSLTPIPGFDVNPLETPEEIRERQLKRGFVMQDATGKEFLRIHRKDNESIEKGLFPETMVIETTNQPIVTKVGEKWETVLTNEVPTPAPEATPPAP